MAVGDETQSHAASITPQAKYTLRQNLASIDAAVLGLASRLPTLTSVEFQIVQQSEPLENPVLRYLCSLDVDDEGRKITVGKLSLEEGIAKSLAACCDPE